MSEAVHLVPAELEVPVASHHVRVLGGVGGPASRTQEYYERRIKQGKTRREIVRCLKRYAAREVFHLVMAMQS
ncbi:hypothetical protein ACFRFL_38155 [Streptomyces sp. NPDC056708]|uniref:hypothetical protein n=1 Tax=unclassified Streptomyces TaxID=2593676 RepID=UPI00368CBC78